LRCSRTVVGLASNSCTGSPSTLDSQLIVVYYDVSYQPLTELL
jgi:hypothetical protein